jgi:hypothetical protein
VTAGDSWELPLNKFFPNVGTPIDFPVTVLVRDSSHQFFSVGTARRSSMRPSEASIIIQSPASRRSSSAKVYGMRIARLLFHLTTRVLGMMVTPSRAPSPAPKST